MNKPEFLTKREWEYIQALERYKLGHSVSLTRKLAADRLGVTVSSVESCISRIRKKMESAYRFKRTYGKLIEKKR